MSKLTDVLKPSQINVSRGFFGTVWQNSEKETIAHNIVIISLKHSDEWSSFTWDEYQTRCEHSVTSDEHTVLEALVKGGYLKKEDDKYAVTNKFIAALAEYIKE